MHRLIGAVAGVALAASLSVASLAPAHACLNDHEITRAEQQFRGRYAQPLPPAPAGTPTPASAWVALVLGALALGGGLHRVLRDD